MKADTTVLSDRMRVELCRATTWKLEGTDHPGLQS